MRATVSIIVLALFINLAQAEPRQVSAYEWRGVDRIVAIGDIHGDYDRYMATLEAAGLVDSKGRWSGGTTHLVQLGDIPDRGPDTLRIIEHIDKLARQAERKGGRVHGLIGNHEVMNVTGDLRYVDPGEYEAFVTRKSQALQDRHFKAYLANLEQSDPEAFENLPKDFRAQFNERYPLGWIEHQQAWNPAWNPEAEYFEWVMERKVAVQVNDTIFLHGGLSGFYCQNSLESLTEKAREQLRNYDPASPGILNDDFGPFWYRGLSGNEPQAPLETVEAILEQHDAGHIVVGHTPTMGVIWPRYDGRVIQADTGISAYYGGNVGYLEITPDGLFGGYAWGKLPLPETDAERVAYLQEVLARDPDNRYLKKRLEGLTQPSQPPAADADQAADETEEEGVEADTEERVPPICGISP
ncbi:MAG: metallophosphoesterase [Xanthomonadales bacterium]